MVNQVRASQRRMMAAAALGLALCWGVPLLAGQGGPPAPRFTESGELLRPEEYREWVYVTSGLGMTYGAEQPAARREPMFDNVFVTREAYREFMRSGTWPEKTMFILEVRRSEEKVSINNGGRTQGAIASLEAAVKDRKRFPPDGWGYFSFHGAPGLKDRAAPLPATARCYACHRDHTAVDNTFVQFYPTLFEVAKRFGTVKPTYDPNRRP
jgi:Cytochrome P460